jgi:hypothetical protein
MLPGTKKIYSIVYRGNILRHPYTIKNLQNMKPYLIFVIIQCLCTTLVCQPVSFKTDTIVSDTLPNFFGSNYNMLVDNNNNIHVVWVRAQFSYYPATPVIMHSKFLCSTEEWTAPVILSDMSMQSGRPVTAIHLNSGVIHIAYRSYTFPHYENSKIIHTTYASDSGWSLPEVVADSVSILGQIYMAIDTGNHVHLAWINYVSNDFRRIYYLTNINGTWERQIIPLHDFVNGFSLSSIAVNSEGVAYTASRIGLGFPGAIMIANNDMPGGKEWQFELIETPYLSDESAIIRIQDDKTMHLLMSGVDPELSGSFSYISYYTYKNFDGQWREPEVISTLGEVRSMVVDGRGKIHTIRKEKYWTTIIPSGSTYYLSNSTGNWEEQLISNSSGFSLSLTEQNRPCFFISGGVYSSTEGEKNFVMVVRSENHCDTIHQNDLPVQFEGEVFVFPNPFVSSTTVLFKNPDNEAHTFELYDGSGQMVLRSNGITTDRFTIQRGHLKSGLYYYRLKQHDIIKGAGKVVVR